MDNNIYPTLNKDKYDNLKWVYISGDDSECDTNDSGLKKLPVVKWKDYMRGKTSSISVIIFKMVISEGWDIPRACMLYQIRDSNNKQLDEQVMGRVRRNPRLLDFETLPEDAQKLACTSWVWGVLPQFDSATKQVSLYENLDIENEIQVTPTALNCNNISKSFNIGSYISNLKDDKITNKSIFDLYQLLMKIDDQIQTECYNYADSYSKWILFTQHLNEIKSEYDSYICDYSKSIVTCTPISFPKNSCYIENDRTITLDDWVWCRPSGKTSFSFDSDAEKQWAEILKDIRNDSISRTNNLDLSDDSNKFLWGKNFPFNSGIKYEYYLDGVHSSYPDFIMKDKKGIIHIFEVKSVNKSSCLNIDEIEYTNKAKAIESCYKEASIKTDHVFYLPILDGNTWKITKFKNGNQSIITLQQFKKSF